MFDYGKLEQRITEVFGGREPFGKKLGLNGQEIDSRLDGVTEFPLSEIDKAVNLLNINPLEISSYFFDVKKCSA